MSWRLVPCIAALSFPLFAWSSVDAAVVGPAITERYVTTQFTEFRTPGQRYETAVKGNTMISRSETAGSFAYGVVVKGIAQVAPGNKPVDLSEHGLSFSRDRKTERITFSKGGGRLVTETVSQTLAAVGLKAPAAGKTTGAIDLDLAGDFLPRRLGYIADTRQINADPPVLLSILRTEPFGMKAVARGGAAGTITGRLTHVLVFNPESHRVFQAATTLEASLGDERVRVETLSFLAGEDGLPSHPIADLREIMPPGLAGTDADRYLSAPPLWYYQSIKALQAGELALGTAAEHAANFAIPLIIPGILVLDTACELATGESPLNYLAQQVGEIVGGEQGALYADTLMSFTKLPLSIFSPSIVTLPQQLLTASKAFELAMTAKDMYQSMDSLTVAVFSPREHAALDTLHPDWSPEINLPEPSTVPGASLTPPVTSKSPVVREYLPWIGGAAAVVGLGVVAFGGGGGGEGGDSDRSGVYFGAFNGSGMWSNPACGGSTPIRITGTVTITLDGNRTDNVPYSGSMSVAGDFTFIDGAGPCRGGKLAFQAVGSISGSSGKVISHVQVVLGDYIADIDFTDGTFRGSTLEGIITIRSEGIVNPIRVNLTLNK